MKKIKIQFEKISSIALYPEHHRYIKDNHINLSAYVRAKICADMKLKQKRKTK